MDSILPGEWVKIFSGVDLSVMVAIGVIAFILERTQKISEGWAMLLPLLIGGAWGGLLGWTQQNTDGAGVAVHIFAGIVRNGAAGSVFGRGVSFALRKYFAATTNGAA